LHVTEWRCISKKVYPNIAVLRGTPNPSSETRSWKNFARCWTKAI
jgi:hypothetical protein